MINACFPNLSTDLPHREGPSACQGTEQVKQMRAQVLRRLAELKKQSMEMLFSVVQGLLVQRAY